jgi:peptidoglycan DL-endopeptidase RipA
MPRIKLIAAAVAGLLVLIVLAVTGGAPVASSEEPPEGGCAVTLGPGLGPGTTTSDQKTAELNANQMAAARTVAGVGVDMGIHERGIAIALGTAMQESSLNPNAVAGRSVGLFQQQGALYSGFDRTDPAAASRAFYEQLVAQIPNYPDTAAGTFADIAQEVQESGAGASKYAQWELWAIALARTLLHGAPATPGDADGVPVTCEAGGGSGPIAVQRNGVDVILPPQAGIDGAGRDVIVTFPNERAAIAGAAALSYLGTPYAWGGGGPNGPTKGIRDGGVGDRNGDYKKVGFDCSGLTEYAWAQAGIAIGGDSRTQYATGGTRHRAGDARPGDLVFVGDTPQTIHHVAIYLGRIYGREFVVESPNSGAVVTVSMIAAVSIDFREDIVRPFE